MSIKVGHKHHDMRIAGRIVGVRSTEQSVGIKVGGFCPRHHDLIISDFPVADYQIRLKFCQPAVATA